MKLSLTIVAVLLFAWPASAQTPNPTASQPAAQQPASPQPPSSVNTASRTAQTITLSGCVGSINQSADQFSLSNAAVVPSTPPLPTPTAAAPPAVTPTTPPTTATAPPPTTTPPSAVPPMPPPSAVPPPTTATTGTTPPATAAAGAAGINASGAASATASTYRLSGANMASWSGQRVQVVGVVVPTATPSANTPTGTSGAMGTTMPEFRVQSVMTAAGDCPPRN